MSFLDAGEDFATSTWDILTGAVKPAGRVLLYDDNGAHPGMTAAEFIAERGIEARSGDARAHARSRRRRDELPRLFPRARRSRERRSRSTCGSSGSSGAATRSPGSSSTNTASAIS